ncbi:roadblock/LC7 domain-containing protein [Streptomyces sp. NPDC048340]|uniref:roadblock/LC7 domain-containing protein n=1 Tax=Streptomyces sp. NPDC048340 TaxID=3365537 RepID=UPI0037154988
MSPMYAIEAARPHQQSPGGAAADKVREFRWLLQKFQTDLPGVFDAAVVSADGVLLARCSAPRAPAPELVSPITSGLAALAFAASSLHGSGPVRRTVLEMRHGVLAVVAVSDGSLLAVAADQGTDRAVLGYEMTRLVQRVGHVLTAELRSTLRDHATVAE